MFAYSGGTVLEDIPPGEVIRRRASRKQLTGHVRQGGEPSEEGRNRGNQGDHREQFGGSEDQRRQAAKRKLHLRAEKINET
ncbi:unnamed protein product [Ceutorhynchus assimilis]|uniref:Uncharacterized protein n=1 Tax=Ceutorhynchus assimilis TaxID=467358 RepID=A0A9N9MTI7_9CUCU|nr:unnamed protein product [Ceutorhynchus assimilis]